MAKTKHKICHCRHPRRNWDTCVLCNGLIPRPAKHWAVTVKVDGKVVLNMEPNEISGATNVEDYAATIRECAHRLLAFIGEQYDY